MATQKIKYEFKVIDQPGTLVLEQPAQVKFINVSLVPGNTVTINQVYTLGTAAENISGLAQFPAELDLSNNNAEEDTTNYQINGTPNEFKLIAILKYFV